jgi:hypothetical protein
MTWYIVKNPDQSCVVTEDLPRLLVKNGGLTQPEMRRSLKELA